MPKIALYHLFPFFTMASDADMLPAGEPRQESPGKKPRTGTELPAFTEEQIASITSNISFDQAIRRQLDSAVKESLQQILPGMLATEMPIAIAATLAQQRADVQQMLDNNDAKLQGTLNEARVAASPAGDAALASQLQLACDKFEALDKKVDAHMGAVAASRPLSPQSSQKYCDEKIAELETKMAASPRLQASPSGSVDGHSTPGLGPSGPAGNAWGLSPYPQQRLFNASSPVPSFGPYSPPAFSSPSAASSSNPFDRPIDPTILKISCGTMVNRTDAAKLFTTIAEESGITAPNFDAEGPALSSTVVIRMAGEAATAARYVRQILESQKKSKTEWKKYNIRDASGGLVPCYINPDKNNRTIKGEIALRRVHGSLKRLHPELGERHKQSKLSLQASIDWAPLVKIVVQSQTVVSLVWNPSVATKYKIKQSEVEAEFNADLGAGANVAWTKFG